MTPDNEKTDYQSTHHYPISEVQPSPGIRFFTLRNAHDMRVTVSNLGATMISWLAPDRYGRVADILLGYPEADHYRNNPVFFGGLIGRWANRIAGAGFELDGVEYRVDANEGANHLHGGFSGFHQEKWEADIIDNGVRMTLDSVEGSAGFPGNLHVAVVYRLNDNGCLSIDYTATTDAPTPINLTSHAYFNLNGGSADIYDHILSIAADRYLKIDKHAIPIGVRDVASSAFDFRSAAPIGPRLSWPETQLTLGHGFDHCYCLPEAPSDVATAERPQREVATVYDPGSGRHLAVATTETGLQFYSGNYLDGIQGRKPQPYGKHDGFCLEAQAFPNQINGPDAEKVILRPGQVYRQTTCYTLSIKS
jgi:aldose 1-epimerase